MFTVVPNWYEIDIEGTVTQAVEFSLSLEGSDAVLASFVNLIKVYNWVSQVV